MTRPRRAFGDVAALAAPFVAAFALRCAAGFLMPRGEYGAVRGFGFYGEMADNLVAGKGLVWNFYEDLGAKHANRGPLLPLLLAALRGPLGGAVRAVEIVTLAAIGSAAIGVPALLARRWAGGRAARAALWIAALWPYSVVNDAAHVEHVLYAPLCGLTLWAWLRAGDEGPGAPRSALGAGLFAGLATLARLTFLASVPFVGLAAFRRVGARRTALALAGLALVLAPWVVRNHAVVGAWTVGTDRGRALLVGNHPATFEHYPAASIDRGEIAMLRSLDSAVAADLRTLRDDEIAQDAKFRELAVAQITADPAASLGRMARKAAVLWSPVYNPGPLHGAIGAGKLAVFAMSFVPLVVAACAGIAVCARLRADLPALLSLLASFTLVAALFWGQPRYLAPLHGLGIAAAAAWIARRPETPA